MIKNKTRIELHCHSKYGGKATMYPGEIVKYLSEMGMPAFAITDESNIGAFPELEMVWETGKYLSRPIYGMEILVEGIDGDTDHLSMLIKNENGKKALYKLISENESLEQYSLFKFDDLIENRDGLLLGSGTEKGRLYKSVMQGKTEKELKEIIFIYDYVEVLPAKQYEEINKIIISICDELKIPVVAVGDARCSDKLGRKALRIMEHWNGENEETWDNYFLNTEEMLEAFNYLSEDKAYEIVVKNTHLIADMCETVQVCPKEKIYPVIENAGNRLKEKCYAFLTEKYSDNNVAALERLNWELSALEKTGMESYILQIKELLDKAELKADDISLRGTAAGSIVTYLLDITNIDPLVYGLEPELIFGLDGQRTIDIDINLPSNMQLEVVQKLDEIEGVGKYVWAGTIRCISDPLAQVMIERFMEDSETYYEEEIINRLRCLISGNYLERGKHPGGVIVFPKGYKYKEMIPMAKIEGGFEVTCFDYHSVDRVFMKYDLLKHNTPEMLIKLKKLTGVELSTIPVDSEDIMALFKTDSGGNLSGCDGLPEFKSEYIRNIFLMLKPKSFNDLVKVLAISHGTGAWDENAELLVNEKGLGIKDIIATRDDVFEYNLSFGLDRNTAFEIAEAVRKGIVSRGKNVKWQGWKKALIEAGAPEWYIRSCEQIRYLFPRAHAISYMLMDMRLGWFKIHYPDEFNKVSKEYEELI